MAIEGTDLLTAPIGTGRLAQELFADLADLGAALLDQWAEEGNAKGAGAPSGFEDLAARAWGTAQGYTWKAQDLARRSAQVQDSGTGRTISGAQIEWFTNAAAAELEAYAAAIEGVAQEASVSPFEGPSTSTTPVVEW